MKSLVIAEKPSVARDMAKVLKCGTNSKGYMEGSSYVITWAMGHLVTLKDPEGYDKKYKSWDIDHLPIIPKKAELTVMPKTAYQYKTIKDLIHRKDVKDIIIATDAGREGELVARWILELAGNKKPVKRLWISSVTDRAILDGFKNLKEGKAYVPLYHSAVARAMSDWLVGINATRALTTKHNAQLSCGRVQTPTLAMVAKKEDEVRSFRPKDFYTVKFSSANTEFIWQDKKSGAHRIFDKDEADKILADIKGGTAKVTDVQKKRVKESERGLYDLTLLQRDANRLYNFSPKQTLDLAQSLYERHKVLTYPRTDSMFISTDIVPTLSDRLKAVRFGIFKKFAADILAKGIKPTAAFVDNSKVSDHHAVVPTEEAVEPAALTDNEMKIYSMVIKRFLACLMPSFEYDAINVSVECASHKFIAKGKNIINAGFKEVYGLKAETNDGDDVKEQLLPEFRQGQELTVNRQTSVKGQTSPPPYFTEGTLVYAMENPKAYASGEYAKTLGETGGLGTVATRADIIEKLFASFYIEKRGNHIFTTSKGRQVLKLAPKDLCSPDLTAVWEQKLTSIAKGRLKKDEFITDIESYTRKIIAEIKGSEATFKHDNITGKKCPDCAKLLLEAAGKKGKMLVCQDRECGYRKSVSINTNARCPQCHKRMELRGEGDGRQFSCVCGFREKMSAFEKRKETESTGKLNKRDIDKYLKKINAEDKEAVNSKIADALKGFIVTEDEK